MGPTISDDNLEQPELELLEILLHDYGFDYRRTELAAIRRKIAERIVAERLQTTKGLREKVLHDEGCRQRLLRSLTLNAVAMFSEPGFFRTFRAMVVPLLRTYPFIRIWHVGCATGEEVYSMAILLEEEGLYERSRLYATDVDESALRQARAGIFPLESMQEYTGNYVRAGGKAAFSEYYTASYGNAIFRPALKTNLVFAQHNLATDGPFNDFQAILCRGLLPAVSSAVQARAHRLFRESLVRLGFLCLGTGESLQDTDTGAAYERFSPSGIYRRIY